MRAAIITNINGIGLQRDAEILTEIIVAAGHEVLALQWDEPLPDDLPKCDLALYLEVLPLDKLDVAPVRWFWGNPEWVRPEMVKIVERHMDRVFAKTIEAFRIFDPLWPGRVVYTGFTCRDQYDASVPRKPVFLHIGGNSSLRGTAATLDAWRWARDGKKLDAKLIIVSRALKERPEVENVTILDEVSEEEIKRLQNECLFHIYPSGTEGYGHAIHEALSVNACLITTDSPPMNEIGNARPIHTMPSKRKFHLADVYDVSALDVFHAVEWSLSAKLDDVFLIPGAPRREFLDNDAAFRATIAEHLKDIAPKRPQRKKSTTHFDIAFIGNFENAESTENMIEWALTEGLGHQVEKLQENRVRLRDIKEAAEFSDLLIWVRTPNFLKVPDAEMADFLKTTQTKTISIHLDKFWGIPEREALIGVHPFWKTGTVFTADGSRDEDFIARGVNHRWMRPAVSEVYCHPGIPRDEYRCDVGFVGARDYHKEYPFRREMVDWLEQTYGERFKHVTGVRGHLLNDVYASMRVVIGDCIFAGTPRYWSDRLPETSGRGGFLIHPEVEGLELWPGAKYRPQNLNSLQREIEFWLDPSHPTAYRICKKAAHDHIMFNHTWTKRLKEILKVVFQ